MRTKCDVKRSWGDSIEDEDNCKTVRGIVAAPENALQSFTHVERRKGAGRTSRSRPHRLHAGGAQDGQLVRNPRAALTPPPALRRWSGRSLAMAHPPVVCRDP